MSGRGGGGGGGGEGELWSIYVVLFTVVVNERHDEGEEGLIGQLTWGVISNVKNQVDII